MQHVHLLERLLQWLPFVRVIDLSLDAIAFKKTKHIMRAAEFLRDLCLRCVFVLRWISGESNPADLFTKAHVRALYRAYMQILDRLDNVA